MVSTPITIRGATLADLDVIVNFGAHMARETEDKTLDRPTLISGVRAVLTDEAKGLYFVAKAERRVVGVLMITYEWSDWRNGHYWWIQSVYVSPEWRRRGVFRALFQHVRQLAQARNARGLRFYVERANEAAQATYEQMGMAPSDYLIFEHLPHLKELIAIWWIPFLQTARRYKEKGERWHNQTYCSSVWITGQER